MEPREQHIEIPEGTFPPNINHARRVPCVLLLDTSSSMLQIRESQSDGQQEECSDEEGQRISEDSKKPIDLLNEALPQLRQDLMEDELAQDAVELTVITFGGSPKVIFEWQHADQIEFPEFQASGHTPLGAAINDGLDMIDARRKWYRQENIHSFRPWIFILTDGEPNDPENVLKEATSRIRVQQGLDSELNNPRLYVHAISTDNSAKAMGRLAAITPHTYYLRDVAYRELFGWWSDSLIGVSAAAPGVMAQLPEYPPQMTLSEHRAFIP